MKSKNQAFIKIHDFECGVEKISQALGIQPTNSWIKGDLIPNRGPDIRRKQSTWEYKAPIAPTEPIEKHLDSLLDTFKSKKDLLKEFSNKYYTELTLVGYEYENCNPGFILEKEVLKKISDMGLTLDVDLYVLLE